MKFARLGSQFTGFPWLGQISNLYIFQFYISFLKKISSILKFKFEINIYLKFVRRLHRQVKSWLGQKRVSAATFCKIARQSHQLYPTVCPLVLNAQQFEKLHPDCVYISDDNADYIFCHPFNGRYLSRVDLSDVTMNDMPFSDALLPSCLV
jgi:hypothetical protein